MKMEIEVDKLENGYILVINDKKWFCSTEHKISRRIITELTRTEPTIAHSELMKDFWSRKVGKIEKKIIEHLNEHPDSTLMDIHNATEGRDVGVTRNRLDNLITKALRASIGTGTL